MSGGILTPLFMAIVIAIIWYARRAAMRRRLSQFDNGTRCIVCHSTNMAVANRKASCGACGHTSNLDELVAGVVTDKDIAAATRPRMQ